MCCSSKVLGGCDKRNKFYLFIFFFEKEIFKIREKEKLKKKELKKEEEKKEKEMKERKEKVMKKAEHQRIDAFELWCWRRLLKLPWTARRSNQSVLKESSPEYSLEGLMLKLKLQYFGCLM